MKNIKYFLALSFLFAAVCTPASGQTPTPTVTPVSVEMVSIPAGWFRMGNGGSLWDTRDVRCVSCELPQHKVTLKYGFLMGKYEVTNAQYAGALNWAYAQGYLQDSSRGAYSGGDVYYNRRMLLRLDDSDCDVSFSGGRFVSRNRNGESMGRHPVKEVTWYGAVAFCKWLTEKEGLSPWYDPSGWNPIDTQCSGYRLPSEAEWEYACRGSYTNPNRHAPFSFGHDPSRDLYSCSYSALFDRYMVWCGNTPSSWNGGWTRPVGSKLPNYCGLHDMHGNVWEWCQDHWHETYSGAPTDGSAWDSPGFVTRHVVRGGSWFDGAPDCRSANRHKYSSSFTFHDFGFRVARTVDESLQPTPTVSPTPYQSADFHPTNWVDAMDLFVFSASWRAATSPQYGDLDGDGRSGPEDLLALLGHWNAGVGLSIRMVTVPAGTFTMGRRSDGDDIVHGSNDELPRHQVTLPTYQIGKFEVTNSQYAEVLNWANGRGGLRNSEGGTYDGGSVYYDDRALIAVDSDYGDIVYKEGTFVPKVRDGRSMADHPALNVSWYGSVAFCYWSSEIEGRTPCYDPSTWTLTNPLGGGYRLPSEAEWERAAAWDGSKHWIYGFRSDTLEGKSRCNYYTLDAGCANPLGLSSQAYTSPVGWFDGRNVNPNGNIRTIDSPSPVGCYDMSGNVWEWCEDWYHTSYDGAPTDGSAWLVQQDLKEYRVVRGGRWSNRPRYCRTARRWRIYPGFSESSGFRVARTP